MQASKKPIFMKALSVFFFIFGILTLKSGGSVLLGEAAKVAAGNYIPFIVGFNVFAGPFYLVIAVALWRKKECGHKLVNLVFAAYLLADVYLAYHIQSGGLFEMRTVFAMSFRTLLWGGTGLLLKNSGQACELPDQPAV